MPLETPAREALLAACPVFRGLDAEGIAAVSAASIEVDFPAGRTIARQGEIGTGLFIVATGSVRVVRDGEDIARLGPGEFFGELSVLDGGPATRPSSRTRRRPAWRSRRGTRSASCASSLASRSRCCTSWSPASARQPETTIPSPPSREAERRDP
jgi:hypothetical protein